MLKIPIEISRASDNSWWELYCVYCVWVQYLRQEYHTTTSTYISKHICDPYMHNSK